MHLLSCLPQSVFQKGSIEIEYLDKYNALHLNWHGTINSEIYMEIMEEMLKFTLKYQVNNWLLDARDCDNFQVGPRTWTYNFFTQELKNYPVRKIARLASGNFISEMALSGFITKVLAGKTLPFKFKYHTDANMALAWFAEDIDNGKSFS